MGGKKRQGIATEAKELADVQFKDFQAQSKAQKTILDKQKQEYKDIKFTNPYESMQNQFAENVYEDMTVNQQQAQFQAQQGAQQRANIMQGLRGSAGGSGIAALAQTLANQGSESARKSAVSIGKQEQANQMKERAEAGAIQKAERQGDIMSRNMEAEKVDTLMRMSGQDVAAERQAVAAADAKMWDGISQAASSVGSMANAGLGGTGGSPEGFSSQADYDYMNQGEGGMDGDPSTPY